MDALVIARFNEAGRVYRLGEVVTSPADMTDDAVTALVQRGRLLPLESLTKHLQEKKAAGVK
jgi:hypothetical protein